MHTKGIQPTRTPSSKLGGLCFLKRSTIVSASLDTTKEAGVGWLLLEVLVPQVGSTFAVENAWDPRVLVGHTLLVTLAQYFELNCRVDSPKWSCQCNARRPSSWQQCADTPSPGRSASSGSPVGSCEHQSRCRQHPHPGWSSYGEQQKEPADLV